MDAELLLLALSTGLGLGFLLLAVRQLMTAVRLWGRGLRVTGVVIARVPADRRRTGLVMFTDHLGRVVAFDAGAYGPLCGLPPIGEKTPVVYLRRKPTTARLWTLRHLLAPAFGWFLSSSVVFGAAVMVTP
ncbi:hypothetical protein ACIRPX_13605 [Streptomyces sp. NPDC101225]|uniref:hypothetical protein n=1 Tax=Streptomyces sp. NPDC101225 TaxID=3366135 RepID=UPI0037F81F63